MLKLNMSCKCLTAALLAVLCITNASSQQSKITDFVIYGGLPLPANTGKTPTAPLAPGVGVQIGSGSSIKSGQTGSSRLITTTGNVLFGGSLYSGGTVSLANSNTISGGITVANNPAISSTLNALVMGSSASVSGNLLAKGNISVGGGTLSGLVIHTPGTKYVGPKVGSRERIIDTIPLPGPAAPPIAKFSAGDSLITTTRRLNPGVYGNVRLSGNQTLTLVGPGVFIFNSIINTNSNTIQFDFQKAAAGVFKIYVANDVDLGRSVTTVANGGNASRIFCQVNGDGSSSANKTVAFNIANGTATASSWQGSVWAPFGAISLGSGSGSSNLTGALWSGTQVLVQNGVNVISAPYQGFNILPNDTIIIPGYLPPVSGKSYDVIGPELTSLCQNFSSGLIPSPDIYRIVDQSVFLEVITKVGKSDSAYQRLVTLYGLHDTVSNGPNSVIITGKIPISNLCPINSDLVIKRLIVSCRPVYPPITNSGVAYSKGDSAIRGDAVRSAYKLGGEGVTIGVLSDSYNTIPGNQASVDVANGDLPGTGNAANPNPVQVLKDYPYGRATDEGRAMLQIVHDVAPKSVLAFRSGFISEGDFAQGIYSLQKNGCKIITDDITYITSPIFRDGLAAKAVDSVKKLGVSYFSAAGNFGNSAYGASYVAAPPPPALTGGTAHNFSGGDVLQNDSLKQGSYTMVLQWEDAFYTLGQGGAVHDFDIYLANDDGTILFGMNRPNIGSDPIEVLPFFVKSDTRINVVVAHAAGPAITTPIRFKFIVYRGGIRFNEYAQESSTLIGQANAAGAMAVGAARYTRTPAFGVSPAQLETFSSNGRTPVNGTRRSKPDFVAPDGGNTTVVFTPASLDIEGDTLPNFFGTSAAAPHAAGAAALILEGKKKFYDKVLEPDSVRIILSNTALDMATPGYDSLSGAGLIQADAALQSFAAPTPELDSLILPSPGYIPGRETFTVQVKGKYFSSNSVLYVGDHAVPTTILSTTSATAIISPFFPSNPPVYMYTPPRTPSGLDGLYSDTLYFYGRKLEVVITADNKTKKFGERLPEWTSTITVDGNPVSGSGLTLADLKLDSIVYTTEATSQSNVNFYRVTPSFKPLTSADSVVFQSFHYTFTDGRLTITKMPLLVTPKDTTITYGDRIGGFAYNYIYGDSLIAPDERDSFLIKLGEAHYENLDTSAVAFVDSKSIYNGASLSQADLLNMSVMASAKSILSARAIYSAKSIFNGVAVNDSSKVVDLAYESFVQYQTDPTNITLVSAKSITSAKGITSAKSITSGVTVNAKTIYNAAPVINATTVDDTSNSNAIVIIDQADLDDPSGVITDVKAVNMITGITSGDHYIVPAALLSENFNVHYGIGNLKIKPAPLTVKANDTYMFQGDPVPPFTSDIALLKNSDSVLGGPTYTVNPAYLGNAGSYSIIPADIQLEFPESYQVTYVPGTLYVNPKGGNAVSIKPSLICVDTLTDDPSGFRYVAIFGYRNDNATTIYVPVGENNFLSGNYGNTPIEYFHPGIDSFKIRFDGTQLRWTIKTYDVFLKAAVGSDASAGSARCKKASQFISAAKRLNNVDAGKDMVTPNPTTGRFIVSTEKGRISDRDLFVTDMAGQKFTPRRVNRLSAGSLEVDLPASITPGIYMIKVKVDNSYKVYRVIKQ